VPARASWSTACPDWQRRIKRGQSLLPNCPWNAPLVARAQLMFDALQLPDVPGVPRLAEAAGPWQHDLLKAIFGSYFPEKGIRTVREFGVMVPKKNAKTTGGAGIMLTAMMLTPRPRAEFLIVAPTQEVSDVAFGQAVGMVQLNPTLRRVCHVQHNPRKITNRRTGAFLKVKSFTPEVVTGSKPAGVLLDEIHVTALKPNADRVIGQLRGGMVSQPEAFMLMITTQSERPPAGVFRAELMKWRAVRDGKLAAPVLPLLYELPRGLDWRDPETWWMVNPNNGFSLDVARLVDDYESADVAGIEELRRWASQHLNVEIGVALQSDYWAGAEDWEAQGIPGLTLEKLLERSDLVEIGIDGGGKRDMLGLAVLGRDVMTGDWLLWTHAWAWPSMLAYNKAEISRYHDFAGDGDLTVMKDNGQDIRELAAICAAVDASGKLDKVGIDPAGVGDILDGLAAVDISGDRVVGIPQGWRLSGAIKTVERRLAEGAFWHHASPLMNWCVGNARVEPAGNAIKITKQAAGSGKIDPLVATFMAAALLALNPQPRLAVSDWIG